MKFTESVRSRQVPETPLTSAWPPRMPSVPTSRATRVTSPANEESWSTIVFTVFLSCRISPSAGTVICCDRSPLATAVVTCAMLRTWSVRLSAMVFTEVTRPAHAPSAPTARAWPPSRPSAPTSRETLVTSVVIRASCSTMLLNTAAAAPGSPSEPFLSRTVRSPSRTAVKPARSASSASRYGWSAASLGSAMRVTSLSRTLLPLWHRASAGAAEPGGRARTGSAGDRPPTRPAVGSRARGRAAGRGSRKDGGRHGPAGLLTTVPRSSEDGRWRHTCGRIR